MRFRMITAACLAAALASSATAGAGAADFTGAGATFPDPIYAKWAAAYAAETGAAFEYDPSGSAAGIKQIVARSVTFGATDMPLGQKALQAAGLIQFPMIMGGIVPVFNLEGIGPGQLVLDGPTLAKIFLGEITRWDDPAIKALNAGLELPAEDISVVHRLDGSGTTFCFTTYLSDVSPEWKAKIGAENAVEWPVGVGAKRNAGVASAVAGTDGALGYVEFAAAKEHELAYAAMINKDGKTVIPKLESFQSAAAGADWKSAPSFGLMLTNQPGQSSWPIAAASFILMPIVTEDVAATAAALKFFDWAYRQGGKLAEELDYVPLPDSVAELAREEWTKIKDAAGEPVFAVN
jgi:phosphate transport system substrate-binding protein